MREKVRERKGDREKGRQENKDKERETDIQKGDEE